MASAERDQRLADVYRDLADAERRHAARWADAAGTARRRPPPERPSRRARILGRLAARFGASILLPTLAAREQLDRARYTIQPEAPDELRDEERAHAVLLEELSTRSPASRAAEALARTEHRRAGLGGNALRAAVLGANDGLVSNLSLVMGVAGAELASQHHPRDRHRGAARGRAVDGDGRVDLGAELARALRAPDRGRAARDRHHAGAGDRGAHADLPRQGRARPRGARAGRADHARRGRCARRDGA